ncbi:MAG: hypothetical protein U0414_36350 [Polyangiaceae bacterium]
MRHRIAASLVAVLSTASVASAARADDARVAADPKGAPDPKASVPGPAKVDDKPTERVGAKPASDGWLERYAVETGRIPPLVATHDFLQFSLHGEYELRFRAQTDLRLEPPVAADTAETRALGLNKYLYHWLRLNPRLDIGDQLSFIGQIDVPRGLFIGDLTNNVGEAQDAFDTYDWYDVHPRELYAEWRSPIGTFRLGQQKSHWGQGILANDGDHPQMFGDPNRGSLVERVLFATSPFGKGTPFLLLAAGDLVFEDRTARLLDGDLAMQGVLGALYRLDWAEIGLYGTIRHQWASAQAIDELTPYDEYLTVGAIDLEAKIRGRVPGANGYAYLNGEAALLVGGTSFVRSAYGTVLDPTAERDDEDILALGASATAGFVHVGKNAKESWGDAVAELEFGYASGDADPYDGSTHRFTFDQNHHVGLVLFDDVMRWKSARSATIAQDPRLVNRANPGLQFLPSEGGVFGAMYLNPRFVVRPKRWADVKLGFVLAQAASDVVDPYQVGAKGNFANYDGGDPTRRDLGLEIDTGFDFRIPVGTELTRLELGAEGGVLFPGHAFDDAAARPMPTQFLVNTKLGMQF